MSPTEPSIPRNRIWILIGLMIVALLQAAQLIRGPLLERFAQVAYVRSEPPRYRSAALLLGEDLAAYFEFVREVVPEDAKVLLPPHIPVQPMANFGLMEFFLMPRELHNCGADEVEACVLRFTGDSSYILTAWKFPPEDVAEQVKEFIPFGEERGVYSPRSE